MTDYNANNSTTLRQADNIVTMNGYLKSKDFRVFPPLPGSTSGQSIVGSLVIMSAPGEEHVVSMRTSQFKRDGEENPVYKSIVTVMNEYTTIADLMQSGENMETAMQKCDKVAVTGSRNAHLSRNEYKGRDGSFVSRPTIIASFVSRISTLPDPVPAAEFSLECYIDKIIDEYANGDPTGRKIVDVIVPIYGGKVLPYRLIVPQEHAEEFEALYSVGDSGRLYGTIVDTVSKSVGRASGFGKAMEVSTFVHELIITGADAPYQEENPKAFQKSAIAAAMRVRETETIPAIMNKEPSGNAPVSSDTAAAAKKFTW